MATNLSIYPNPAHGSVQVSLPAVASAGQAVLTLTDALGRAVRRQTLDLTSVGGLATVSLAGLAPGVYALRTQAGAEKVTRRLVVE